MIVCLHVALAVLACCSVLSSSLLSFTPSSTLRAESSTSSEASPSGGITSYDIIMSAELPKPELQCTSYCALRLFVIV